MFFIFDACFWIFSYSISDIYLLYDEGLNLSGDCHIFVPIYHWRFLWKMVKVSVHLKLYKIQINSKFWAKNRSLYVAVPGTRAMGVDAGNLPYSCNFTRMCQGREVVEGFNLLLRMAVENVCVECLPNVFQQWLSIDIKWILKPKLDRHAMDGCKLRPILLATSLTEMHKQVEEVKSTD